MAFSCPTLRETQDRTPTNHVRRFNNLHYSLAPAANIDYADIERGPGTEAGQKLLEMFTVMKDQGTCQDPLAVSQKSGTFSSYKAGIVAPGGWLMATQRSDLSLQTPVNQAYYTQEGRMQAFLAAGFLSKSGPGTFIVAMENPNYSFAGTEHEYSYGCSATYDNFPFRREPFSLSVRIEIPETTDPTENKVWAGTGGKFSLTNHITNRQVVYEGADFDAKMNQALGSQPSFNAKIDLRWTKTGCNNNRAEDQNEPVPEGFWR